MSDTITMRCPTCKLEVETGRQEYDPPTAVVCETECPECNGGDFALLDYFDAGGKWIDADPAEFMGNDEEPTPSEPSSAEET